MIRTIIERKLIERQLATAVRVAEGLMPFSPAWDAAMANVEDLERQLWRRQAEEAEAAVRTLAASSPIRR